MRKYIKKHSQKWIKQHKATLLKMMVTIFFSVCLGIFFGLFILFLTDEKVEESVANETPIQKEKKQAFTNKPLTFYVVQAGVFKEENNATKAMQNKQKEFIWEEKDQFYLFIDVANDKSVLKEMYEEREDVFIKEISIAGREGTYSETEQLWMEQFQADVHLISTDLDKDEYFANSLQTNLEEDSKLQSIKKIIEETNDWETPQLLQLLMTYKKILEKE